MPIRYETYVNRGAPHGADPFVTRRGGVYYYCFSGRGGICVAPCASLAAVRTAHERAAVVWTPPAGTEYSRELWAPELHFLGGTWYIYFAADDGRNENHRMYALRGTSDDPTAPFVFAGRVAAPTDKWAIDGTVFPWRGALYFVWSGWEGDVNIAQNLYIARMSDPCTVETERVCISRPEYPWETNSSPRVNEGPAVLTGADTVRVVYSASGSWLDSYCLACLTLCGGDPLDPASWTKSPEPLLVQQPGTHGPGHCSFTDAPDGSTWMFYHANETAGSGWRGRSLRMQPVDWDGHTLRLGRAALPDDVLRVPIAE